MQNNVNDLIVSSFVRRMVGNIHDQTLWRWLNDESYKSLNFPKPTCKIKTNYYWRRKDVEDWVVGQEQTFSKNNRYVGQGYEVAQHA